MEDVLCETNLAGVGNVKKFERIAKTWNPQPQIIEINGHKGFNEQEKAHLVRELEQLKNQFEAQERQAYLEKVALRESQALPVFG